MHQLQFSLTATYRVLQPQGFHAYYCRGSCRTSTAAAVSMNQHATALQVNY